MNKKLAVLLYASIFFIASCGSRNNTDVTSAIDEESTSYLCNFNDSTTIILQLIHNNNLSTILEESDPEQIDVLIKNYSPAEIAFESEVLSCTLPTILYFFDPKESSHELMIDTLETIAQEYENQLKIVVIDATIFSVLTAKAVIEQLPTCLLMRQRAEVSRLEGIVTQEQLKEAITELLSE